MSKSTETKKARRAEIERKTAETQISIKLNLDGEGTCDIATGIGFLDHMLTLLAKHSFMDLTVKAKGDLEVDSHHTVEDIGIVLGEALREALGDKAGIHRYGNCFIPMDETLAQACLDFSGRPFLVFGAEIPKIRLENYDTEMTEEFFRAVAMHCGLTLHIRVLYGSNVHHIIEAIFKAFARAVAEAAAVDPRVKGVMSSKGVL
ncbi:imidazoleglycerol-phosphate dehydratase [Succiniclasticum ruminis]|jgi:imidazoleglycerol-phosphate dehydratase|uniref:Imidazoleglycerol-phosphate dehydratase n=1 Tax=Succiniclasticum ruminis TaxID=40841 RepID=A0A1G6KB94_9FIRM|nr:imidazoleglycerol-phosphate dehydratase HisB [Succiniclasticum ruminis]SDC28101.1 imidazoleglycerol-phosphate dehydratase [Succiniclasticum ruminis]